MTAAGEETSRGRVSRFTIYQLTGETMSLDLSLVIDTGGEHLHQVESFNITHNLDKMASALGIYDDLWRPKEDATAGDLAERLDLAIDELRHNMSKYRQYDASNRWGTAEQLLPWLEEVRDACWEHPKCMLRANR